MTSPILMPTRNIMRDSASIELLRCSTSFWNSDAQTTADTALWNSANTESPAVLNTRPPCSPNRVSMISMQARKLCSVLSSLASIILLKPTTSVTKMTAILRIIESDIIHLWKIILLIYAFGVGLPIYPFVASFPGATSCAHCGGCDFAAPVTAASTQSLRLPKRTLRPHSPSA